MHHIWFKLYFICNIYVDTLYKKTILVYQYQYTVDPIYRGAWGPSSASAIYPDRDISHGGSLSRRR